MSILIHHVTLVNWTPAAITPDQAVLIEGDRIAAIGRSSDLTNQYPDAERYDGGGKLLMPGNICAHTHFYGAFARGLSIPGDPARDFPEILRKLWWNLDKALDDQAVHYSAMVCLIDAIKHGTTALIDHHASPNAIPGSLDRIAQAVDQSGLRAVLCYEVTDRDGTDKMRAGIAENVRFHDATRAHPGVRSAFGLHASLTLSDATLMECVEANAGGAPFHIHAAEHEADQDDSIDKYGVRVIERLKRMGILNDRTIVAHAVHIDDHEIELLAQSGAWVSHQPRSNMNNGVGAQQFDRMIASGVKMCLGNDGFSNDMWAEWKQAYLLHKSANRDPRLAPGDTVAKVATDHNARLLEQFFPDQRFGVLALDAAADMILVDYHPFTPLTPGNLPWHVLFGFENSMVTATIARGNILMWDRVLKTVDEAAIAAQARALVPALWERFTAYAM